MKDLLKKAILGKEDKDIVVIGKGGSVDKIHTEGIKDYIVINVNDSEMICPGDVAVFHNEWVLKHFEVHEPQAKLYITDQEFFPGYEVFRAGYVSNSPESNELLMDRFFSPDMNIEQSIVASALKIANVIAELSGRRKNVYLIGFDFSIREGFTARIANNLHGLEENFVENTVRIQEHVLRSILSQKDRLKIDIRHVGSHDFSFYSVHAFNELIRGRKLSSVRTQVGSVDTTSRGEVQIVAEITTNHFGDWDRLEAMIRAAKNAGADFIKLQKRDVASFYSKSQLAGPYVSPFGTTFGDYRFGIELSEEQIVRVQELCTDLQIGWFMSILDLPSYQFMKKFNPHMIKLPSTISEKKEYLKAIGEEFAGDLVVSTGFTDRAYEDFIFQTFRKARKIYLLQCTSAYPTPQEHAQLGVIRHYYNLSKKDSRIVPGYSSHDLGSLCSMMAVAAGALMIEKHVKFGEVSWSHFDQVALDMSTDEFKNFVSDVRKAERIVGKELKEIHPSEHHKY